MRIERLQLRNWRNFHEADVALGLRNYVVGANASGKSNLLDVFRFLRTLTQRDGGGLQAAIKQRGGLSKLRSLHARKDPKVRIEVDLLDDSQESPCHWRYALALKSESAGQRRWLVAEERVERDGKVLLNRPDNKLDGEDIERLTETHLEQTASNAKFRQLTEYLATTTYLHLVPQLLTHGDEMAARIPEHDPFGQGLLQRIAKTPTRTRDARLQRIQRVLVQAVPQFSDLRFAQDGITGLWHLEANFAHWRVHGAWQREDQFSDGTLRLIGLLWALQEGDGLLLLEEPELSLNDSVVAHIPLLIDRVLRDLKKKRQIIVSTHSETLLNAVGGDTQLLRVQAGNNGSTICLPSVEEQRQLQHGLTPAEVLLPKTHPPRIEQLGLLE